MDTLAGRGGESAPPRIRSFRDLLVEATPRFFVTPTLLGLNIGWFAVMVALGVSITSPDAFDLRPFGASFGPLTLGGEWWRLLSATFVHVGLFHLAVNMWALWILGVLAERMFGNFTFLTIYLLSGLGGSVASVAWHPEVTSAGASGAIFGIVGALVAFLYLGHISIPRRLLRDLQRSLLIVIGLNLFFGAVVPGIDNAGHLGGLVVGLVTGAALHRSLPAAPRPPVRFLVVPLVALGLVATLAVAVERSGDDAELLLADAIYLRAEGETGLAADRLERAIELDPELTEAYVQLGLIELERERLERADRAFERALALAPDSDELRSDVGLVYLVNDRIDRAVELLREAAELDPDFAEHQNRLALALARRGSGDEALAAIENALAISPDAAHLVDSLGTVRFYRGELELAVEAYRRAVEHEPDYAVYRFNLGVALRELGKTDVAEEELAEARRLDPELQNRSATEPLL